MKTDLSIIIDGVLDELKNYDALGKFKQWIVNADGSSMAVYEHGALMFDKNGKRKNS